MNSVQVVPCIGGVIVDDTPNGCDELLSYEEVVGSALPSPGPVMDVEESEGKEGVEEAQEDSLFKGIEKEISLIEAVDEMSLAEEAKEGITAKDYVKDLETYIAVTESETDIAVTGARAGMGAPETETKDAVKIEDMIVEDAKCPKVRETESEEVKYNPEAEEAARMSRKRKAAIEELEEWWRREIKKPVNWKKLMIAKYNKMKEIE